MSGLARATFSGVDYPRPSPSASVVQTSPSHELKLRLYSVYYNTATIMPLNGEGLKNNCRCEIHQKYHICPMPAETAAMIKFTVLGSFQ